MAMRVAPRIAVLLAPILVLGALAVADDVTPRGKVVLHEPMPGPASRKPGGPLVGDEPRAGKNPTAFTAGDKVLIEPSTDSPAAAGEPIFGDKSAATDRQTEDSPDRQTGADSTLHYVAVFNPDVVPFKRLSALDTIADDYTMKIARTALVEVPVGGKTDRSRDRFWGSLQVRLDGGEDIAIPSVAPDMRILSYEVEPPRSLVFSKDGADNYYVRTDETGVTGVHRLVFLADADAGYFAPSLPSGQRYTPGSVRRLAPPEIAPVVPAGIIAAAKITLDEIGIDDRTELSIAFNKLVGFFRAFEAKKLPSGSSGDIYRDLCDHKAGVCRHRSFAFMVTANALGIPTRYVTNEAHAFVEVWFPGRNWQRIDLGGAAMRLEVSNAKDKTLHRPRAEDPFEKPKEYSEGYTQLEGDIKGLSDQQLRDKHAAVGDAPASGDFADPTQAGGDPDSDVDPGAIGPDPSLPARTADPRKLTPRIEIFSASGVGYRGETMHVEGKVSVTGGPLADRAVDAYLAPSGRNGESSMLIGRGTTEADGTFSLELDLPAKLELRNYELYISTREDARYNPAISD
jgi:hypothetical protein